MNTTRGLSWRSAGRTDVGCVRKVNEDACLESPGTGLWVVADGMGGHEAGDVASRMIVDSLRQVRAVGGLNGMVDDVERRIERINAQLIALATRGPEEITIGSTVAVLAAFGRHGMCLWAGDSRIYRLRDGHLQRMTRDHSEVEDLIDLGEVDRARADEHPSANVITRAVGGEDYLELDSVRIQLRHRDRYLLCSDGLTKEVSEPEIAAWLPRGSVDDACRALIQLALDRGSRDNVTVVVVEFKEGF